MSSGIIIIIINIIIIIIIIIIVIVIVIVITTIVTIVVVISTSWVEKPNCPPDSQGCHGDIVGIVSLAAKSAMGKSPRFQSWENKHHTKMHISRCVAAALIYPKTVKLITKTVGLRHSLLMLVVSA